MTIIRQWWSTAIFGVLAALLSWNLLVQLRGDRHAITWAEDQLSEVQSPSDKTPTIQTTGQKLATSSADTALAQPGKQLSAYRETVERPLFSSDRRPLTEEDETAQPVDAAAPLDVVLSGVVTTGTARVALLKRKSGDKVAFSLSEGQFLDKWKLVTIGLDNVIFERDEERVEITLDFTKMTVKPKPRVRRRNGTKNSNTRKPKQQE